MTLSNYQGSYSGLTFGGAGDPIRVISVKGWDSMPPIRTGDAPNAQRPGSLAGRDYPDERTVEIELDTTAPSGLTMPEQVDNMKAAFAPSESTLLPLVLQLPGQVARQSLCRVRKRDTTIDVPYEMGLAYMSLQFVAPDPIIYGATLKSLTTPLATPSSGATFPASFPLTFGGTTGSGGTINCANLGDYPVQGVATITGPCINPRVQNNSTDEVVGLNMILGSGDVVVIDFAAHTVVLNGNGYRYSTLSSGQWWSLEDNAITTVAFYSSDPSPTGATMRFDWRDGWM